MKSITIKRKYTGTYDVIEKTIFDDTAWLVDNNYISKQALTSGIDSYVLGPFANGKDRLTPLTYISFYVGIAESFIFEKDNGDIVEISYEDMQKTYSKAEENLQNQYKVATQLRIGVDYLVSVFESGV